MSDDAKTERQLARAMRMLLEEIQIGDSLPETVQLLMVLGSLERLLPAYLAEIHPYWMQESLDGFLLAETKKVQLDQAELRGLCILITDQSVTPFQVRMQLSPTADEIAWMECHLGQRGDGAGQMTRIPWPQWSGRTHALMQKWPTPIEWAYSITFGAGRVAASE